MKDWLIRLTQAAVITITMAAVLQEMEKPQEERRWHGRMGIVPYDFRFPSIKRIKEACWNPDDERIFTEPAFGIGWRINVFALLEKMRIISESCLSEDDFLMPTPTLRKILEDRPPVVEI